MKSIAIVVIAASLALPAAAQEKRDASSPAPAQAATSAALADGEVRRVDKDAKKITIKHGPLASLDMPAMTMVFQVADPAMLDQVKAGDRVKFKAEKVGGAFKVTEIEAAR